MKKFIFGLLAGILIGIALSYTPALRYRLVMVSNNLPYIYDRFDRTLSAPMGK